MAKFKLTGKRKRFAAFTAVALSATLALGTLAACGGAETEEEPEENASAPTDVQVLKNGNFEFFSEMTEDDLNERRNLINSPNSWTISTVSPASDTKSGIVDTSSAGWNYLAKSGKAFGSVAEAYAHWEDEDVTAYDRLKFLSDFESEIDELSSTSPERELFDSYSYSIDYEDVQDLAGDFPSGISLHAGVKEKETHVLMLHNSENSDGVLGTAQYCTSSTTITLKGGTAAMVSVWVRTDKLTHYADVADPVEVTENGGAYIGITNTVGGDTSSGQMRIRNINTSGEWEQYTVYIRANTFATTTYRLVLGLGENTSSDNRLYGVNGYAFFDDVTAKTITEAQYLEATAELHEDVKCGLGDDADARKFDATKLDALHEAGSLEKYDRTFAFDLLLDDPSKVTKLDVSKASIALTEETSGSHTLESKVPDNQADPETPENKRSYTKATDYNQIQTDSLTNLYLQKVFADDFEDNFPFYLSGEETVDTSTDVIMLLSTNGAAYTAKLTDDKFTLAKDSYLLLSFFVKTSAIRPGKSGATVTLVDGENKTAISSFDSTTVDPVDIDDDIKDIYKGWVQCFFLVKNESDGDKTFSLEFSYGVTSIVGSDATKDYADGYAAFAALTAFELTKKQAGYLSTGNYSKSVTLTEFVKDSSQFDSAAGSSDIEHDLAVPATFRGSSADNDNKGTIYSGLLNADYKNNYYTAKGNDALAALKTLGGGSTADEWWQNLFADDRVPANVATQPLVIYNAGADAPSYGYSMRSYENVISANSTQRISMRLKVSEGMTAYLYLTDLSDVLETGFNARLTPTVPQVTYWYDDDGNIVKGDPTASGFNKKTDVLYYLEENGLYTRAGAEEENGEKVYYANLHNYDKDDEGNLVTGGESSQIVYYKKDETDTDYYAYRKEDEKGNYEYSQIVRNLPLELELDGKTTPIYRYLAPAETEKYQSVIAVPGTAEDTWIDVSFYIRTGNREKKYLLELWAGEKDNTTDGFKAGGYVFADKYANVSSFSDFDAIRSECVSELSDDAANRVDPEKDDSNLIGDYALYYTFSFFDSDSFVRYDKTQDTEDEGNPWVDYKQSGYSENIVWLRYNALGAEEGTLYTELFLDFSVAEQSVSAHVYDNSDDSDTDTDDADATTSETNVWLIISSAVLAVALIFTIAAVIVRRVWKQHNRGKIKVVKEKSSKNKKRKAPKAEKSEPAGNSEPGDENDPYNE